MDDADLEKPLDTSMILKWFGRLLTIEEFIDFVLIGHPYSHLDSICKTVEP